MNLKQMEYFVAAAEQLEFYAGGEKCFISQTAMTLQIQSLEEKIGVPLFVRDKHHVELTAAGKVYLNEARRFWSRAEEAAKLARIGSGRHSWGADDLDLSGDMSRVVFGDAQKFS